MGAKVGREHWPSERVRDQNMEDVEPAVLIVGGGQCGLIMAARLNMLDISVLVIEKNERVGDNWRNRYES
jgi:cation diffusion facilitator CzcD-associated flavoprotein CzcO